MKKINIFLSFLIIFLLFSSCTEHNNIIDTFEIGSFFDISKYDKEKILASPKYFGDNILLKSYLFWLYDDYYFEIAVDENEQIVFISVSESMLSLGMKDILKTYQSKEGYSVYMNFDDMKNFTQITVPIFGKLYKTKSDWFVYYYGKDMKYPLGCTCDLIKIDIPFFEKMQRKNKQNLKEIDKKIRDEIRQSGINFG